MTLGKWVYIAESSGRPSCEQILNTLLHSAWIEVSVPVDVVDFYGFVIPFPVSEVLLTTCPDCLLTLERWAEDGKPYTALKLFSRRRELTAAELDFYKKQVTCLSLPPETFMDPQKELCPDTTSCFS
ncbi:unnamed protein product, partial [Coregonus sp. 'balchen']